LILIEGDRASEPIPLAESEAQIDQRGQFLRPFNALSHKLGFDAGSECHPERERAACHFDGELATAILAMPEEVSST
jgi:hypothetical protein